MEFNILTSKKNIISIFISLLLGIVFWYYAKTDSVVTIQRKYPLKIESLDYLITKSVSSDSITLEITAKIRVQRILRTVVPIIAVPNKQPGSLQMAIKKEELIFPAWLKVMNYQIVEPDSIKINLDSLIQKKVKIASVKGIEFAPNVVIIKGPKSLIKNIDYLSPDSIPTGRITTITVSNKLIEVMPHKIWVKK